MDRRNFIINTSLAGTGLLLSSEIFAFTGSPNEKIVMGIMGTNSRGAYLMKLFAGLPNVEIGFVCDVDKKVLDKTLNEAEKLTGKKPKGYSDIRKMLEEKDMDAIAIAAPDHWHAPAAIMACEHGKHVYVEKPCSHNPFEGEMLVKISQKTGKLVQIGTQRRSFPNVREAMQDLKEGIIGRPYFAKGWYANNRKSIGFGKPAGVPDWLNYDLWQGPAPRKPYKDNLIHYNWHWFWNWGTGEALNNGTHELDVMRWGLGVDFPTKVVSAGGRFQWKDDWETPDTQTITYEFANNTGITWEGRSCNNFGLEGSERGVIFYGEKGTMVIPGGDDYKVYDGGNKIIKDAKTIIGKIQATNTVGMGDNLDSLHLINFVESIRGKSKLNGSISEGYKSTLLPQLGNIAYRTGRTLICDPLNGHIQNDKEAMKLWTREYEKGWEIK